MSSARKSPVGIRFRGGYLKSVPWFRRRDCWFAEQETRTDDLRCVVCGRTASRRQLELHHLDYTRVTCIGARWIAEESHEDLCAMHPTCHDAVHRVLDSDPVLRSHRTRPVATIQAIQIARRRIHAAAGRRP